MRLVAVTQRVDVVAGRNERRDAVDQQWTAWLAEAGYAPLLMPNQPAVAVALASALRPCGLLLTGGNDLFAYGGDAPERDETELALLAWAEALDVPVLAVCRGMQLVQHRAGVPLAPVEGHVTAALPITRDGEPAVVNSYHRWGAHTTAPPLEVFARAGDGVVKGLRAPNLLAVMWHPERERPFRADDLAMMRQLFR